MTVTLNNLMALLFAVCRKLILVCKNLGADLIFLQRCTGAFISGHSEANFFFGVHTFTAKK